MWHTPHGVRRLRNAERRLIVQAVTGFQDQIGLEDEEFEFQCEILNHSRLEDRWYLPLIVAEDLLGTAPAPEVRAWNAALIHEIFLWMRFEVELDIDRQRVDCEKGDYHPFFLRRAISDALKEKFPEEERPRVNSADLGRWDDEIGYLEDEVLCDHDYQEYGKFADVDPERARAVKLILGIPDGYFEDNVPLLGAADKERLYSVRTRLLRADTRMYNRCMRTGRLV